MISSPQGVLDIKHVYKKALKKIERMKKRAAGGDDGTSMCVCV
jgi:hypothetical protein